MTIDIQCHLHGSIIPDGDDITECSAICGASDVIFVAKAVQMAEESSRTPGIRGIPAECNLEGASCQGTGQPGCSVPGRSAGRGSKQ
jgi:hypothetical protein